MTAAGFCSWQTAEQNLAGSPCKSLWEPALWKYDWRFEQYKLQRVVHFPVPLLLYTSWTQSFLLFFSVTRESSAKTPLRLCAENRMIMLGLIYSDMEWSQLSVQMWSTRCSALLRARSLSNVHRAFHTVIHYPAQEVQDVRHFPYRAAKQ